MGKEAKVDAYWPEGGGGAGKLQYEPPKLIFRGAERRVFEGVALAGVRADGRDLILAGDVRFRLPGPATSWAEAIANPKSRLDKLGVKAGLRVDLANLDDPGFKAEVAARAELAHGGLDLDLLFFGADSPEDLAAIDEMASRLSARGALWIISLKGKAARLRDVDVMAAAKAAGLVDTKVCAFSDAQTSLRFVRRRV